MKIKAIYVKNLKMPEGKVASQIAHAVKNLGQTPPDCDIAVLSVSKTKFDELVKEHPNCYVQVDKGLTVVAKGTATAAAWVDKTDILTLPYDEMVDLMSSDSLWEDTIFEYEGIKYRYLFVAYQYLVEEYGMNEVQSLANDFDQMFKNGMYVIEK